MKKVILALLVTLVFSSVISITPSSAATVDSEGCVNTKKIGKTKVLFEKEPTKDVEKLYKMAKEKKGFLSQKELDKFTKEAVLQGDKQTKDGEKVKAEVETMATSELIEVYETDGVKTEVFSVTEFAVVTEEDLVSTLASEKDYGEKTDSSISVRAYSTNNYNRSYANGENSCIDLISVSGGWTRIDSSVSIGTKSVQYGQTGRRCGSGSGVTQNSLTYHPSSSTYAYAVPSSWVGVTLTADVTVVGHKSTAELTRRSSKWTLSFTNNVNS